MTHREGHCILQKMLLGTLLLLIENSCAADRHFVWSSVCYGYIVYDTVYEKAGNISFLLHHAIGLVCCCVGLYLRRMAYFGAVIQVFFEATTPFMHALGCMKTMGWGDSTLYAATGALTACSSVPHYTSQSQVAAS